MSLKSIELVVFILHVNHKEQVLESLPSSLSLSFASPDELLQMNFDVILLIIPVDIPLLAYVNASVSWDGEASEALQGALCCSRSCSPGKVFALELTQGKWVLSGVVAVIL